MAEIHLEPGKVSLSAGSVCADSSFFGQRIQRYPKNLKTNSQPNCLMWKYTSGGVGGWW
jgi:hypothetical protein